MLFHQLCFFLCAVVLMVGCKEGGDTGGAGNAPKPPDPLAKLVTTTTNAGQAMFSLQHPEHYTLSRMGEGDTATLAWGGAADEPSIFVRRANPAPGSLDEALGQVGAGGAREVLKKEESPEQYTVLSKDGSWVSVTVWTRTKPMLRCQVDIEVKTESDPRIAHARAWCQSIKIK